MVVVLAMGCLLMGFCWVKILVEYEHVTWTGVVLLLPHGHEHVRGGDREGSSSSTSQASPVSYILLMASYCQVWRGQTSSVHHLGILAIYHYVGGKLLVPVVHSILILGNSKVGRRISPPVSHKLCRLLCELVLLQL